MSEKLKHQPAQRTFGAVLSRMMYNSPLLTLFLICGSVFLAVMFTLALLDVVTADWFGLIPIEIGLLFFLSMSYGSARDDIEDEN